MSVEKMYEEDEMLMLSGIQHFAFCPRQWGLIHLEQQWSDNRLTMEGSIMHEHVDDPFYRQSVRGKIVLRRVSIASKKLGLYGLTDIIEMTPTEGGENCVRLPGREGWWSPCVVEYKHGEPKFDDCDSVQIAAQTMCLEEQYGIRIPIGQLYYGKTRQRESVLIDDGLRQETKAMAEAMHRVFEEGVVPKSDRRPQCRSCSMVDLCMPEREGSKRSAKKYLKNSLYEEDA